MALGYKYYRHKLIELMILNVGGVAMFWDYFKGHAHPDTQPTALVLVACLFVFGNVGLFIAMRRAKRREIKASAAMKKAHESPAVKIVSNKMPVKMDLVNEHGAEDFAQHLTQEIAEHRKA